jgi:8-oxo-dGTP pyrophosphatase MutT (NUDIX family)
MDGCKGTRVLFCITLGEPNGTVTVTVADAGRDETPVFLLSCERMVREISAGGVVLQNNDGEWWLAAIELPHAPEQESSTKRVSRSKPKATLCLPKGLVDPGEKPLEAALREVREETGITAVPIKKLGDSKYVYVRSWGDGERVFKIVSFYLLHYESGRIDNIADEMRIEVARAKWVRLEDAPKLLAYGGEKQMARQALEYVKAHPEL